jgi:sarcosine/dimethylglycine N-methyltransferase
MTDIQKETDITANGAQRFGEDPLEVRDTNHYTDEYISGFVDKWDELIDWRRRYESEGNFFIQQLKSRGVQDVLDVATGTGFHSVRLVQEGFNTVSADGSAQMLAKAFDNGLKYGEHILRVVCADWRWLNRDVHGEYDAIICLGNSFTHLFSERDRRKALAEFYAMLKHDGVLIIDQRNYDNILDDHFTSKHTYYYAGEDVSAEPEYVDDGLARFRYTFPDQSQYHLNMFPLRKNYLRRLLREVGFQQVETYGDFQETNAGDDPDFFIHIAEKSYLSGDDVTQTYSSSEHTARDYYNSEDADNFYYTVWGGEDIHVGTYDNPSEDIFTASRRTVEQMADAVDLTSQTRVLDIGSGFGGSARYLAAKYGCHVTCLNVSERENQRNRAMNAEQKLDHLIEVTDGSFEELPYEDNAFDVVWSQDAFLHSGDREQVLREATRVLKAGGQLVFTDPMAVDDVPKDKLAPILERINLETMATPDFYRRQLGQLGITDLDFSDRSHDLPQHYQRVLEETERHESELEDKVSEEYRSQMKSGLRHWVEGGRSGNLAWGIFSGRN